LSSLLGNVNLNIKVKHKPDLKTKFTVKIGGAAAPQCLHASRHCSYSKNVFDSHEKRTARAS